MHGAGYKETHMITAMDALRLLLDIQASSEIIAEMLVHVMTASQEQCVEMAGKTNTD